MILFFVLASLTVVAQAPPSGDTFAAASSSAHQLRRLAAAGRSARHQQLYPVQPFQPAGQCHRQQGDAALVRRFHEPARQLRCVRDRQRLERRVAESTTMLRPLGSSATGGHATSVHGSSINQFVLIDITPLVQQWVSGSLPNNGLALSLTTSGGSFSFDSKEVDLHQPSAGVGDHPERPRRSTRSCRPGQGQQGDPGRCRATRSAGNARVRKVRKASGATGAPGAPGPQGPQGMQGPAGPAYSDNWVFSTYSAPGGPDRGRPGLWRRETSLSQVRVDMLLWIPAALT